MFEVLTFTEAKLATLTPRSEKHGEEDVPAVSLGIEMTVPNTLLDTIDNTLRPTLYAAKPDETPELPTVEPSTPVLRCHSIERLKVSKKYEGWTLKVDDGVDETQPATFGGCKVDAISVEPLNGGSVILRARIGTSDIDAERSGMLAMHVGQPIWIVLLKPEQASEQPAGDAPREPDATDLFVGEGGSPGPEEGDEADSEGGETSGAPVEPQRREKKTSAGAAAE